MAIQDEGKYMTSVKLGPKGQIVIPKEVRRMFGIDSGDTLLLLADRERGIALQSAQAVQAVIDQVMGAQMGRGQADEEMKVFAQAASQCLEEEES